jgi:hypothetical protein
VTAWSFIHVILSVALLSTKRLALARAEISLASLQLGGRTLLRLGQPIPKLNGYSFL